MAYHFFLGVCPLPINPSALNIKTPSLNKTVQLINDAEINIPKDHGLREVSFDFLLPTFQKYPFASYQLGDLTAATIILYLKWWKSSMLPLPFIVVRMSPRGKFLYFTSFKCVIEDFTFDEDAKEHGFDTMCSITLKEYVDYGTKRVKLKEAQNGQQQASTTNNRSTADRQRSSTVKPKQGESATSAMKREGWTTQEAGQILEANGINSPDYKARIDAMARGSVPGMDTLGECDFIGSSSYGAASGSALPGAGAGSYTEGVITGAGNTIHVVPEPQSWWSRAGDIIAPKTLIP